LTLHNLRKLRFPTRVCFQKSNVLAPARSCRASKPLADYRGRIQRFHRFDSNGSLFRMPCPIRCESARLPMFTKTVKEAPVRGTAVEITGSIPATTSGMLRRQTERNRSVKSGEIFKFTLVAQGKSQSMLLEIGLNPVARTRGGDRGPHRTGSGSDCKRVNRCRTSLRTGLSGTSLRRSNLGSTRFRLSGRIAGVERR